MDVFQVSVDFGNCYLQLIIIYLKIRLHKTHELFFNFKNADHLKSMPMYCRVYTS